MVTTAIDDGSAHGAGYAKIIVASSLGTVFEWYDFYLYGSLAVIIGHHSSLACLWYPVIIAAMTFVIGLFFVAETKDVDITA